MKISTIPKKDKFCWPKTSISPWSQKCPSVQMSRSLGSGLSPSKIPSKEEVPNFFLTKIEKNPCKEGGAISLFWCLFELLLVLRQHGDKGLTQLNSTHLKKKKNTSLPFSLHVSPQHVPHVSHHFCRLETTTSQPAVLGFPT